MVTSESTKLCTASVICRAVSSSTFMDAAAWSWLTAATGLGGSRTRASAAAGLSAAGSGAAWLAVSPGLLSVICWVPPYRGQRSNGGLRSPARPRPDQETARMGHGRSLTATSLGLQHVPQLSLPGPTANDGCRVDADSGQGAHLGRHSDADLGQLRLAAPCEHLQRLQDLEGVAD